MSDCKSLWSCEDANRSKDAFHANRASTAWVPPWLACFPPWCSTVLPVNSCSWSSRGLEGRPGHGCNGPLAVQVLQIPLLSRQGVLHVLHAFSD
eukprot:579137-Amphidinium_carterae.2